MASETKSKPEPDERRNHLHGMWSAVAGSWGEHAEYTDTRHAAVTASMVDLTAPRPGERVLELACGAGGLGLVAARQVGPTGEVVLSDVAAEMVAVARARIAALGVGNATARVLDLEDIDESDNSFDVALCRDGLQFTLDPTRAVTEIRRVVRPGGRVALAVWGPRAENPWLGVVLDAVSAELERPIPPPGMPGPFALDDREALGRLLDDAGFDNVGVTRLAVPMFASSFDEWWSRTSALAGPLSAILAGLTPDAARAVRGRAERAAEPFTTATGLAFDGVAHIASARPSMPGT